MVDIIVKDAYSGKKHCGDFKPLEDGTSSGDTRYCSLSDVCRQVDYFNGKLVPMASHYLEVKDELGRIIEYKYYCTGFIDSRSLNERRDDDKVS